MRCDCYHGPILPGIGYGLVDLLCEIGFGLFLAEMWGRV